MDSGDNSLSKQDIRLEDIDINRTKNDHSSSFEHLGDLEEGRGEQLDSGIHQHDGQSRGGQRESIGSSFKSNVNTIRSPTSRGRKSSVADHSMLRRRRDSSFNYSSFAPGSNHSQSSSYQNSHSQRSADEERKANTAYNSRNYHFEVFPSEMPDTASSTTTSSGEKTSVTSTNEHKAIPEQQVLLRPKQIHQNPLTPQVLPQGFTPINNWSRYKAKYHKEWLAEFLGTFILISLGDGCSMQNLLNQQEKINEYNSLINSLKGSGVSQNNGTQVVYVVGEMLTGVSKITQNYNISTQLGWAGSVVAAFCAAGGSSISGAHLSWCITLINFLFRGSPKFRLFFPYLFAQLFGAYVGGLTLFGLFQPVIKDVFPDWKTNRDFISMFVTVPLTYLTPGRQFISEFIGSFYLVIGIFAMTDPYNNTSPEIFPVLLFLFIFTMNASMSLQTGAALNFSRDLGPRLALWSVGVDHSLLFDSNHHYFWVPMVAPLIGGILGAFTYDLLIFRGQESWVNKPLYQNVANLKKRSRKIMKFFRKMLFIRKKKSYYDKNPSYAVDTSDEEFDSEINDRKYDEGDDNYLNADQRHRSSSINGVRFANDNTSLNTAASSNIPPEQYADMLNDNEFKRRGSEQNSSGGYSLNNIPEEEFSLEEEEMNDDELNDKPSNFLHHDNVLSKSKNVFRKYNNSYLGLQETDGKKKNKNITFKSNKHARKFVPTVEREEKM